MKLDMAAQNVQQFVGDSLTEKLSFLENRFRNSNRLKATNLCDEHFVTQDLISSALLLKQLVGQLNVIIHAVGILTVIPNILESDEIIEELSLGAGNTGRKYDLETNKRIAEFKFIQWRGGAESIRQNSLFKDFYELAEADTNKRRILYLIGLDIPLIFLNGRRDLESVMSKNIKLLRDFRKRYGEKFKVVREYFHFREKRVELVDLGNICQALCETTDNNGIDQ